MHLARTVEHTVDVDGMLARMEPDQFNEWQALYNLEPWGDDWWQAAAVQGAVLNANRGNCEAIPTADLIPTKENMRKNSGEIPEENLAATWRARLGV